MKICVLHSYEGPGPDRLTKVDTVLHQLAAFTDQHTFEDLFVRKSHAKEDINAAVAKGFDFYVNLLWGATDDPVPGLKESQYFESLGLPSCGIRTSERAMTKNDFYENARRRGSPPVPGVNNFPLFVKPASSSASHLIDERSLCQDEEELRGALRRINKALYEARIRRAEYLGIEDREAYANAYNPEGRDSDDIVVQEYIEGLDMTCSIIQMSQACIALTPCVYRTKDTGIKGGFLTPDLKFDSGTTIEPLHKSRGPALFERIQHVAIDAYMASGCRTNNMGCEVDVRVRSDDAVFAIGVNPLPSSFKPEVPFQDLPIIHSFPGGYRALINTFISNASLEQQLRGKPSKMSQEYDRMAPMYDTITMSTRLPVITKSVATEFDYHGTVFDLGCGTGLFGRLLREVQSSLPLQDKSRLFGFDISCGMLKECKEHGAYDAVHRATMETALVNFAHYAEAVDHVVMFSSACLISSELFSFLLVLCFALANKSIALTVDHVTDKYNKALVENGCPHLQGTDHFEAIEAFGEPPGWRLKKGEREFCWTSPKTGDDIYATCYRFERVDSASRDIMFSNQASPD
ncbi:2-C-methyl-D-erythritol 2,4-cyclodiphosphate synthase [Nemania abortiva]|nr:2-C-methyl-D-erythritol 2,4-cyclodiphosphate synthase [Nemania abortiva]